jgi:hypothetical protein
VKSKKKNKPERRETLKDLDTYLADKEANIKKSRAVQKQPVSPEP